MDVLRLLRHLAASRRRQRRAFPPAVTSAIGQAVRAAEEHHRAEIRFVVECALDPLAILHGQSPRERALELFSLLRVWDTERNDGVLVYVLMADRAVEIVVDRGLRAAAPQRTWTAICRAMEDSFKVGDYEQGSLAAILAVAQALGPCTPAEPGRIDELPDEPVLM